MWLSHVGRVALAKTEKWTGEMEENVRKISGQKEVELKCGEIHGNGL